MKDVYNMSVDEMIQTLKSQKIQKWVHDFLENHYMDTNPYYSDEEKSMLQDIIFMAQTVYNYTGESTGFTDTEYDILYEKLDQMEDAALMTVPIISKDKDIVFHKYKSLRGTLDKIYYLTEEDGKNVANKSRRGLDDWIKTSEKKIFDKTGKHVDLTKEEVYLFPKWDGVSCVFEFDRFGNLQRALTRGFTETNEAQNITHIFKDWVVGPWTNRDHAYGIKTEIVMTENDLFTFNEIYHTEYKNSRSIVSAILTTTDTNMDSKDHRLKFLKIKSLRTSSLISGYETIQELSPGAFDDPYVRCTLGDTKIIEKFAQEHKYVNDVRCDGVVIYLINYELQRILGRENNKQKFEVAYKFTEEIGYSQVEDIEFTIGLFGRLNPIVRIKPIKLKGNTIERISLGSYARFKSLSLAKGDVIKVLYDIIPYAIFDESDPKCKRNKKGTVIDSPEYCPECNELLTITEDGTMLYCNNKHCPCRIKGKILNYLNKINIDGISYATIDTLYNVGLVKKIPDLYELKDKKKKLKEIPGFGDTSINNMLKEIADHNSVTEAELLGAIGIESASKKTFEKVLSHIKFDDLLEGCFDTNMTMIFNQLTAIPGIKEKNALKIITGIRENEKLIGKLEKYLTVTPYKKELTKFSVCFTKVRDPGKEMLIYSMGGEVTDTVTKNTTLLVVPMMNIQSSKVSKAQKYNIPIVPIDDLEDYLIHHISI